MVSMHGSVVPLSMLFFKIPRNDCCYLRVGWPHNDVGQQSRGFLRSKARGTWARVGKYIRVFSYLLTFAVSICDVDCPYALLFLLFWILCFDLCFCLFLYNLISLFLFLCFFFALFTLCSAVFLLFFLLLATQGVVPYQINQNSFIHAPEIKAISTW